VRFSFDTQPFSRNILQEIKRLGQMQLFNTVSNIDMIVEKMPTSEIEKWMEVGIGGGQN
jgi:16S rRNA A1518/A1519 N6-dimethyltransferase RsmA/KsgA/DIM1 with predicted DNA glycosylase/AP lyase activity